MNLNKVLLIGNLTRDPEMRYLPSNAAVVNIGVAVNRKWKNQQTGEWQEEATFIDCEAFGKTAEFINEWFKKGKAIFIEGRLKLDQWQDKEGQNRSKLKVIAEQVQFVGGKGDGQGEQPAEPKPAAQPTPQRTRKPEPAPTLHSAVGEDDIPF